MKTNKLVLAALMCAIVILLTLIVLPLPIANGYINLGDAGLYAAVHAVGGVWGIVVSAVGSMISDLILGYSIYAPATFVIKGAGALVALLLTKRLRGRWRVLGLMLAGAVIAGEYFLFEGLFITGGFAPALVNLPFNLIQGGVGAVLGYVLMELIERIKLKR